MSLHKITEAQLQASIKQAHYRVGPGTLTTCVLELHSGFTVLGESGCVDPAMFNQQVGEQLAYKAAFAKLWPLAGYALSWRRYEEKRMADAAFGIADELEPLRYTFVWVMAKAAHEVNRDYCRALGDDSSWSNASFSSRPNREPRAPFERWASSPSWARASRASSRASSRPCSAGTSTRRSGMSPRETAASRRWKARSSSRGSSRARWPG